VASATFFLLGVAVHADHHGAIDLTRYRVKAVAHAAVAVAAEQVARLAVHDLALHKLVGYEEFVTRDLVR
jgi:hypothetical protein